MLDLIKTTFRFLAQGAGNIQYAASAAGDTRKLTLRAQGIIGFIALVAYIAVAGLLITKQREALQQMIRELERVHMQDDALTKASTSLAHAVREVNEAYVETQTPPRFDNLAVSIEAAEAGLQPLLTDFPSLARFKAGMDAEVAAMRSSPSREGLLNLRDDLHALVGELDMLTSGVREHRRKIADGYRIAYDSTTVIAVTMALSGFVLFGGLTALFFSRLAWDIKRLEQRALQVVRGYRGEPLRVTRGDEVGGLMHAVNQMQADLRHREQQLEIVRQQRFHQEKMAAVGSLAASIAHEINNPIAAITGVAQEMCSTVLQRQCRGQGAPCVPELILEQAQRIARITRQVSDLAAPQSAHAQWMDLNGLVSRTSNFVSYDQRLRGVDIQLDLDSQLPAVFGVPDEISQIAMNLMLNAGDAVAATAASATQRPQITLSTRAEAEAVVLTVTDNGMGMSDQTRARAFEEGFTTKPKGSGMGLFICKSLVEARGGRIELVSTPGAGTTVRVTLPQQSQQATTTEEG